MRSRGASWRDDDARDSGQGTGPRHRTGRGSLRARLAGFPAGTAPRAAAAAERVRTAAKVTDEYVHGHPWQSIAITAGIAAIIGAVIGLLVSRR